MFDMCLKTHKCSELKQAQAAYELQRYHPDY